MEPIKNRYEFVMLYDVENGNPNGDPDAGNMPRIDPETGHGIVTDVCIKRKIRNYVEMVKDGEPGYDIYVRQDVPLETQERKGRLIAEKETDRSAKGLAFRDYMCSNFFDIRTFGAVMASAIKKDSKKDGALTALPSAAAQVRGPVQIAFGKSIDPIVPQEVTITRVAITTEEKAETASTEMGRKHIVPYALYRQEGFISANLARKITGFDENDLALLWEAITHMFEFDRSAARGIMTLQKLVIFKHESELGNAPSHKLFEAIKVSKLDDSKPPRAYSDYSVTIDKSMIPDGVSVIYQIT